MWLTIQGTFLVPTLNIDWHGLSVMCKENGNAANFLTSSQSQLFRHGRLAQFFNTLSDYAYSTKLEFY
jgi:hypothetical protein